MITLLASSARTTSGSVAITAPDPSRIAEAVFQLSLTAVTSSEAASLRAFVQHSVDGTNYDDFVAFSTAGSTFAVPFRAIAQWVRGATVDSDAHVAGTTALAVGVLQGPVGPKWRLAWSIGATGTSPFTFSVGMEPILIRP